MSKPVRHFCIVLAVLAIIPSSTEASVKGGPTQLSGYKVVRVHYSPLNKMIMSVRINGQRANLLVDTASSQVILDAAAAASFGIKPSQGSLGYIRFTQVNGQQLPVGFAQNLTAGSMSFREPSCGAAQFKLFRWSWRPRRWRSGFGSSHPAQSDNQLPDKTYFP